MSKELLGYFSTFGKELASKVERLDQIIGRDHWLSVGNYKESLIRGILRASLPKRYDVSTGFVLSAGLGGSLIKSKQIDVLIWDSSNYSPVFQDGEFVIVPPEACRVVVEVKGRLRPEDIETTINSFDSISEFRNVPLSNGFLIRKYLLAFEIDKSLTFPTSVMKKLASSYMNSTRLPMDQRQKIENSYGTQDQNAFDGIYILDHGMITSARVFVDGVHHFVFDSFTADKQGADILYTLFETDLQATIASPIASNSDGWYLKQPGLLALKSVLRVQATTPKSKIIVPPVPAKALPNSMAIDSLFSGSLAE